MALTVFDYDLSFINFFQTNSFLIILNGHWHCCGLWFTSRWNFVAYSGYWIILRVFWNSSVVIIVNATYLEEIGFYVQNWLLRQAYGVITFFFLCKLSNDNLAACFANGKRKLLLFVWEKLHYITGRRHFVMTKTISNRLLRVFCTWMIYQIGFFDDESSDIVSSTDASVGRGNPYIVEFDSFDQPADEVYRRTLVFCGHCLLECELCFVLADESVRLVATLSSLTGVGEWIMSYGHFKFERIINEVSVHTSDPCIAAAEPETTNPRYNDEIRLLLETFKI